MFSINQGVPFVLREPGKGVSTAVIELARQIQDMLEQEDKEEELEVEAAGRSRLSRLFGSR
jgi:MinD-like ATPase involved in chromosome partitioning or flagellar assembly